MDQPARGGVRGCLGNQEKEPLRNPGLDTPFVRLLDSGILNRKQVAELRAYKAGLDPVHIAAEIDRIQQRLIKLAAGKTARMEREIEAKQALPDSSGIRVRPSRVG